MPKTKTKILPPNTLSASSTEKGEPSVLPKLRNLAFIALVLLIAYWPALHGGILWDDDAHITKPELRSWNGLWRIWFELGATQQYYPLTHSFFWLQHFLWGDHLFGYHLVNLVLHGTAALLLFGVLQRLRIPGAGWAAAIFALHPVMVESVAWITELKNALSTVFYLAAGFTYFGFNERRAPRLYLLALAFFILALLSKSVTATLPAALLVVIWFQRGTMSWKRDVVPLLPWFFLGAAMGLFTAWVERKFIGAEGAAFELSAVQRLILAGRVIWFYLGKLFWPSDLLFVYPRWKLDASSMGQYLYLIGALVLLVLAGALRHKSRAPLATLLLFGGTLFPVLGFFNVYPFLFSYVADHFQYSASIAVIALFSAGLAVWQTQLDSSFRPIATAVGILILGILSVLTWRQSRIYVDARTLYTTTLDHNPACWMAQSNLGDILMRSGETDDAIAHYRTALDLYPGYANTRNNLGYALTKAGKINEGIEQFKLGLSMKPENAEMHYNLGDALLYADRPSEAIEQYSTALLLKPLFTEVHCNLAYALFKTGEIKKSIDHYKIALQKYNGSAELHFNLGAAYSSAQQNQLAQREYETALQINPGFTAAQVALDQLNTGRNHMTNP